LRKYILSKKLIERTFYTHSHILNNDGINHYGTNMFMSKRNDYATIVSRNVRALALGF